MKLLNITKLTELVDTHAQEELAQNKIGCKEVLIHQKGVCVFHKVYGKKSVGGEKASPNMLYRAASMTKPITAVALMQLVEKGMIGLEDPVARFLPAFQNISVAVVKDNEIREIRKAQTPLLVRNLLNHTSGIDCAPINLLLPCVNQQMTLEEAVGNLAEIPLSFEPNTCQQYSTTGAFDVAAFLVQKLSGMPYAAYLKKNIFDPIGMKNTTFDPTKAQWSNMAVMHGRSADGQSINAMTANGCVFEDYLPKRTAAGAGLAVTAEDYIRFADMLCFDGLLPDGKRILTEQSVKTLSSLQLPAHIHMSYNGWGFGVRVVTSVDYPHGLGIGCFGWSGAYGTHFWVDKANSMSVVMMKNSRYDGGAGNCSACQLEEDVSASLIE